jgi:hypothetical protein
MTAQQWEFMKQELGEKNDVIDELMRYEGLEEIKRQFLDIKTKVSICEKQGQDPKRERFNIVFQGNPGTGEQVFSSSSLPFSFSEHID